MSIIYIDHGGVSNSRKQQLIQEDENTCFVVDLWGLADFYAEVYISPNTSVRLEAEQLKYYYFKETPIIEETEDGYTRIALGSYHSENPAFLSIFTDDNGGYYSASYATGNDKNRDSILL